MFACLDQHWLPRIVANTTKHVIRKPRKRCPIVFLESLRCTMTSYFSDTVYRATCFRFIFQFAQSFLLTRFYLKLFLLNLRCIDCLKFFRIFFIYDFTVCNFRLVSLFRGCESWLNLSTSQLSVLILWVLIWDYWFFIAGLISYVNTINNVLLSWMNSLGVDNLHCDLLPISYFFICTNRQSFSVLQLLKLLYYVIQLFNFFVLALNCQFLYSDTHVDLTQ